MQQAEPERAVAVAALIRALIRLARLLEASPGLGERARIGRGRSVALLIRPPVRLLGGAKVAAGGEAVAFVKRCLPGIAGRVDLFPSCAQQRGR